MSGHTATSKALVQQCWLYRFGAVLILCTSLLVVSIPVSAQSLTVSLLGVNGDFPTFDEADLAAASSLGSDEMSPTQLGVNSWRRRLRRQMEAMQQSVLPPGELSQLYSSHRASGSAAVAMPQPQPQLQMPAPPVQDAGIGQLVGDMPPFINRIGISYKPSLGMLNGSYGVEVLLALVKRQDRALLGQNNLFTNEDGDLGNSIGLAYRQVFAGQDLLLGVNGFFDRVGSPILYRMSIGGEAKTSHVSFFINWYKGIGGDDLAGGGKVESADILDMEVAVRVPAVPWVELAAQHYQHDLQFQDDVDGQRFSLRIMPVPLISMAAIYDKQEGEEDLGIAVEIGYRPGVPFSEQISPHRVRVEQARFRMLEPVRHDGRHIYDRRRATVSQS